MALLGFWTRVHNDGRGRFQTIRNLDFTTAPL